MKQAYCKLHAVDGMVNIYHTMRSSNSLPVGVVASRCVAPDGVPADSATPKEDILIGQVSTVSVGALFGAAACPAQQFGEVDEKQLTHFYEDAPFENKLVARTAAVDMPRSSGEYGSSFPPGPKTHLDNIDDACRSPVKRTRHRLYRRWTPP